MGVTNVDAWKQASPTVINFSWHLCLYSADTAKFLCIYATMEEASVHHFDSETKLQSKQWKHATHWYRGQIPKNAYAGKLYIMASVFSDSEEVMIIEYLYNSELTLSYRCL